MADNKIDKLQIKSLDKIIQGVIDAIGESKAEVYEIAENSRKESARMKKELVDIKRESQEIMKDIERLTVELVQAKTKLMHVNKNFGKYSQEDLRRAYEYADKVRLELELKRQQEKHLIQRHYDLEIRIKDSLKMLEKAEGLINTIGVTLGFLSGDLLNISSQLEDLQTKQLMGIRIIKAQEDERHRVAREIHDGPAQSMSNVVLKAEICERILEMDIDKTKMALKDLKEITRECLKDIRRIIYDLRPMSLDDLGLVPTLNRYIQNWQEDNNIEVFFRVRGDFSDSKKVIILTVFRVVQEALNNIKKHAKSKKVNIIIENNKENKEIRITISDDGVGFDIVKLQATSDDFHGGFGVFGMKERVNLLNGKFEISSSIGKGTTVEGTIPIVDEVTGNG